MVWFLIISQTLVASAKLRSLSAIAVTDDISAQPAPAATKKSCDPASNSSTPPATLSSFLFPFSPFSGETLHCPAATPPKTAAPPLLPPFTPVSDETATTRCQKIRDKTAPNQQQKLSPFQTLSSNPLDLMNLKDPPPLEPQTPAHDDKSTWSENRTLCFRRGKKRGKNVFK